MAPFKVNAYLNLLGKTPEYASLLTSAQKLHEDQSTFFQLIPAQWAEHCALGPITDGRLIIMAGNGAIAAKLKQISPSLLLKLQKLEWQITAIQILVQADSAAKNTKSSTKHGYSKKKLKLSASGKECLNQLAATLPDSELKSTIQSFVKKHQND